MRFSWLKSLDNLTLGAITGIIGVFIKDLLELGLLPFIPDFKTCPRLTAGIVLPAHMAMQEILPLLGLEIDIGVGAIAGIIVVQALVYTGFKNLWFKGFLVGLLAWIIIDITLAKLLSKLPPPSFLETQISLIVHFIFGISVVFIARKLHAIRNR